MGYLFKENNKSRCLGRYDSWIFDCCGYNNRAYINNASCDTVYEAFKLAAKKAPEMGVAAMAVSLAAVPVVSMFTKKYDDKFLDGVFAKPADED